MLTKIKSKHLYYLVWFIALVGVLSSLFFSEVLKWAPCEMCWYQRIFLYPLAVLLPVGIIKEDRNLPYFVLPLSILGAGFALYQYLLQMSIIPKEIAPCRLGVSCADSYMRLFGFVTIPLLSLFAFVIISVLMYWALKLYNSNSKANG